MKPPAGFQNSPEAFRAQLVEGHYNELRVALFYMLAGCHVRIGFDGARYDITLVSPKGRRRVEVKWDKRAAGTGRLYFEVENTRQRAPSGIMATTADIWCHVLGEGERALIVPVPALREFLAGGGFQSVHTGGQDSNSRGLLVPVKAIPVGKPFHRARLPSVEEYFGELYRRAFSATSR